LSVKAVIMMSGFSRSSVILPETALFVQMRV